MHDWSVVNGVSSRDDGLNALVVVTVLMLRDGRAGEEKRVRRCPIKSCFSILS